MIVNESNLVSVEGDRDADLYELNSLLRARHSVSFAQNASNSLVVALAQPFFLLRAINFLFRKYDDVASLARSKRSSGASPRDW